MSNTLAIVTIIAFGALGAIMCTCKRQMLLDQSNVAPAAINVPMPTPITPSMPAPTPPRPAPTRLTFFPYTLVY